MTRNYVVALLWAAILIGGVWYFSHSHWRPDAFSWQHWFGMFAWPVGGAGLFLVVSLDTPWRRRVEDWYYAWKHERECSPEELQTIKEERANKELLERLEMRKRQTHAELMGLKALKHEEIQRDVRKRQQQEHWKEEQEYK